MRAASSEVLCPTASCCWLSNSFILGCRLSRLDFIAWNKHCSHFSIQRTTENVTFHQTPVIFQSNSLNESKISHQATDYMPSSCEPIGWQCNSPNHRYVTWLPDRQTTVIQTDTIAENLNLVETHCTKVVIRMTVQNVIVAFSCKSVLSLLSPCMVTFTNSVVINFSR